MTTGSVSRTIIELTAERDEWKRKAERYEDALNSISRNGCCDGCGEARKVARAALKEV